MFHMNKEGTVYDLKFNEVGEVNTAMLKKIMGQSDVERDIEPERIEIRPGDPEELKQFESECMMSEEERT